MPGIIKNYQLFVEIDLKNVIGSKPFIAQKEKGEF